MEEIGNNQATRSNLCNIIFDCREWLQQNADIKLQHEGRATNRVGDSLARHAQGRTTPHNIMNFSPTPPLVCNLILLEDLKNCNMSTMALDDHG